MIKKLDLNEREISLIHDHMCHMCICRIYNFNPKIVTLKVHSSDLEKKVYLYYLKFRNLLTNIEISKFVENYVMKKFLKKHIDFYHRPISISTTT